MSYTTSRPYLKVYECLDVQARCSGAGAHLGGVLCEMFASGMKASADGGVPGSQLRGHHRIRRPHALYLPASSCHNQSRPRPDSPFTITTRSPSCDRYEAQAEETLALVFRYIYKLQHHTPWHTSNAHRSTRTPLSRTHLIPRIRALSSATVHDYADAGQALGLLPRA